MGSPEGAIEAILKAPVQEMKERGVHSLSKCFIVGAHVALSLATPFTLALIKRLLGDKADDRTPMDQELAENGGDGIEPDRSNQSPKKTQEGRKLRCFCSRWKGER